MIFCTKCGHGLEDGVKFCNLCGVSLEESAADTTVVEVQEEYAVSSETTTSEETSDFVAPAAPIYQQSQQEQSNQQYYQPQQPPYGEIPGKNTAIGSMVCGIASLFFSVILWAVFGYFLGLPVAIVGLVLANSAKKQGFVGGIQMAGLVTSIVGLVLSAISATCIVCIGCAYGCAMCSALPTYMW